MYFFFNEPATTEIYTYRHTLSLHDALPISPDREWERFVDLRFRLNPDLPRSARLMLSLERDIDDDDVLKISCRKPLSLYVTREMTRPGMDGLQRWVEVNQGSAAMIPRSEERRVGKECGSTCRSRGSPVQ